MTYRLSRLMHVATAGYGVYASAKPDLLPNVLETGPGGRQGYRLVAYTWTARDLPVSALGALGPDRTVPVATALRIAFDLGDGVVLGVNTDKQRVRAKVLGVTLGWAAANALALWLDSRRSGAALRPWRP